MAYIEGYEYDIFISYAHLDNKTAYEDEPGWVEQFFKALDISLDQRYGQANTIKIWWDERIEGNTFFDQSIEEGIKKSAIMICLLSPGYLESEYCQKELELFHNKAQQEPAGLKVGDRSRLFNVLLYNIPYKEWPAELNGTTGFPFYSAENEDDWGDKLDTEDHQFRKQLIDLKKSIVNLLEAFKGFRSAPPPPPPPTGFPIYFGDVADSLRSVKKRIVAELENEGFAVICDVPPPYEKDDHERVAKEKIEQARLSVHLLDQFPGREVEGESTIWYPQKQVELGLQSSKPQLIWMPAETDITVIEEEQYKTFVQLLESGQYSPKKIDFIRGAKSELSQQIKQMVEQIKKEEQATNGKLAVLLDTHFNDQIYAWEVGKMLLENGIQPFINPVEDDPKQNANSWEERISKVSKLVFFYGKVPFDWVRGRMEEALHLIFSNFYPVEEFIVFMVPPHKDPSSVALQKWVLKVNVINNSDTPQLDTGALQQFIQNIKSKRAVA